MEAGEPLLKKEFGISTESCHEGKKKPKVEKTANLAAKDFSESWPFFFSQSCEGREALLATAVQAIRPR